MTAGIEWWQTAFGGGVVGAPILGLVLWGKLLPSWVVNRNQAALEKQHAEDRAALVRQHADSISDLKESHQRELDSKDQAHRDALAVRDRENAYLAAEHQHERERGDVERGRSDALADRVGQLAHEFGAQSVHLIRALPEAADRERPVQG